MFHLVISIFAFYNVIDFILNDHEKIVTPINNPNLHITWKNNTLILTSNKNEGKVRFKRKLACDGYLLFVNGVNLCYDETNPEPIVCTDKKTLWDVVETEGGFKICTSSKHNIAFGSYFYEYCLKVNSEVDDQLVSIMYPSGGYEGMIFDIYDSKSNIKENMPERMKSKEESGNQ